MTASGSETSYPTDESLTVIKGIDISKSNDFWTAVLKVRGDPKYGGKTQVKLYLWTKNKDGKWKRRQNFTVNPRNWADVVKAVDYLMKEPAPTTPATSPPASGVSQQSA